MEPFYFAWQPVPFIRERMQGKPEAEIVEAEHSFFKYLDIALRVFEAREAEGANQPQA